MYNNKSSYFTLFVVTLILSVPTFGQTPDAATNTVATPSSPIPPGGKEKDVILQTVSDIAKATIEANKVTMDTTATFYRERAEQDNRFFTILFTLIGVFVTVLGIVIPLFGRSYVIYKLKVLAGTVSEKLENEVNQKFGIFMTEIHAQASKTLRALAKNSDANSKITIGT